MGEFFLCENEDAPPAILLAAEKPDEKPLSWGLARWLQDFRLEVLINSTKFYRSSG
jgi:hypothetical protein